MRFDQDMYILPDLKMIKKGKIEVLEVGMRPIFDV